MITDLCPPVRLWHNSGPDAHVNQPWREPMRGRHLSIPDPVRPGETEGEWQSRLVRDVLAEIEMTPRPICSVCGRELALNQPRQYEIAGTWDNFGPDTQREPCAPAYLSICRQPAGVPDWEM